MNVWCPPQQNTISNLWSGAQITGEYLELWPIPYSAIEANKDAVLEQNPGYSN